MAHSKKPNRTTHPSLNAYKQAMVAWNKAHEKKDSDGLTAKERVDKFQQERDEARKPKKKDTKPTNGKNKTNGNGKPKTNGNGNGKKKDNLKPAPWGRNDDGSPKKQPSASSQIATHERSVKKAKEADAAAKKKKYETDRDAWINKTRNSPAQKSGAWKGKEHELYEQHLKHKKWKADRKAAREARKNRKKLTAKK